MKVLSFLIICGILVSSGLKAQDVSEDFFEDEFDEPIEDPTFTAPPAVPGGRENRFNVPPSGPNLGVQPAPRINNTMNNSFGGEATFNEYGQEQIQFRLVDPPKYWKPKKRRPRPEKSTGSNI